MMKTSILVNRILTLVICGAALSTNAASTNKKAININDAISFDENNVILSFAGLTDVHLNPSAPRCRKAFGDMLDYLKDLNDGKDLDSVVLGGDLVDTTWSTTGTDLYDFREFDECVKEKINPNKTALFYTLGNHDVDPTSSRGADAKNVGKYYFNILGKEYFQKDDNYLEMFDENGNATNAVTNNRSMTLNGIHFIAVTPDYFWNSKGGFSAETINFLKNKLDQSVQEDPNKPIFVTSHSAIINTSTGSTNDYWTYADLEDYLKDYPQVIYLSGHIHNNIADDRSICQRDFTMVDLGSTKNSDQFNYYTDTNYRWNNYNTSYAYENATGTENISSGTLFKVDNKGNVQIRRVLKNDDESIKGELKAWYIDAPKADKSHLVRYNRDYQLAVNQAPSFGRNKFLYLSERDSEIFATISAATDDSYVEYYEFKIKTEYEELITVKRYSTFYFKELANKAASKTPIYNLGILEPGKYIIELRAGDAFHALSEPIISTINIL